jgi:DNA modification methylase
MIKIEQIKISKLKPATYNPRQITTKQYNDLKKSIEKFGIVDPIIINKDMTVIGGHQRLKICTALKYKEIDCVVLDLSKEEERELNIRLNKNTGEFDMDILANEFDIDELVDWGFKHIDLDINIDKIGGNIEDDHIPEVKESKVKRGDIWQLGEHRLMCGDSTIESDVIKLMNGQKADMVFTDPPYGVNYEGGIQFTNKGVIKNNREKLKNDNNTEIYNKFLPVILPYVNGAIYMWFSDSKVFEVYGAVKSNKCEIHALIIWHKTNATYAAMNAQYKQRHEPCLYFKPKGKKLNWVGSTTESTIWELKRDAQNNYHPTQKPIALAEKAIRNHTGNIVLDIFLGSGSTLIACEKTNRICYGMELDTKYCDVIIERWQQFTNQKATKCGV